MVKQSKSILARLLANENITVQRGNYKTAFFDVEKRILGLPLWEDYGKDVEDLLIGHEVGHALFTPSEGWHDSLVDLKIPKSFLNVVEDIRIERKIQSKYPGLVNSFKKGYKVFSDLNFFNTEGKKLEEYSLIDRLNLKAKLRDLVDIEFTPEEKPYVDQAFLAETWQDVVDAAKAIHEFMKEQKEEDTQSPEPSDENDYEDSTEDQEQDLPSPSEDGDKEESEESTDSGGDVEPTDEDSNNEQDGDEVEQDSLSNSQEDSNDSVEEESILESETDNSFRENEEKLELKNEDGLAQPKYVAPLKRIIAESMIVPYPVLKEDREKTREYWDGSIDDTTESFNTFESETKKVTDLLAKEFEMRKAAFRTLRASEAKSGTINVNKLHSYKFEEDIFAKVTSLADAQSHGMVMMVDFSGSMVQSISSVINQTLSLVSFCKKVNIPFDVYSFTTQNRFNNQKDLDLSMLSSGDIDPSSISIVHLIGSSFSKTDYKEAYRNLYDVGSIYHNRDNRYMLSHYDRLGGTPLNETLLTANILLSDFKRKHGIQKTNLVILSDGEGSPLRTNYERDPNNPVSISYREYALDFNGKILKVKRENMSEAIVNEFSKMGINTICFYVTASNQDIASVSYMISRSETNLKDNRSDYISDDIRKSYRKEKLALYKNTCGYNQFFILKANGKSLDTEIDSLDIGPRNSKAQIKKAFSKYSMSKKVNRVLATKFAQAIA